MPYTFIDVEYANNKNRSLCQIGLININDEFEKISEYSSYINPCDGFDEYCTRVHGITKGMVSDAPSFIEVWDNISKYFTNSVIVGHNVARADIDAIIKNQVRYNIDIPEIYYVDTMDLAESLLPPCHSDGLGLSVVCDSLGIDMGKHHDAMDDVRASYEIFKMFLKSNRPSKLNDYVRRYFPHEIKEFASHVSDSEVRHMISEFYGKVKGFQYDGIIQKEEMEVIKNWHSSIKPFARQKGLGRTLEILENILKDGVVTLDEAKELEEEVAEHLNNIPSSQITVSTQILEGILKGIKTDRVIKEKECSGLREWLVSHDYLRGHYPFDRVMAMVDEILEDGIVTESESERIISCISSILDPVNTASQNIENKNDNLCGKIICLSGNFAYGTKGDVEEYLKDKGATVESSVKKTTNILLVGSLECTQWSNGNYGTKVVKAMEYNEKYGDKGVSIKIMKENELIKEECSKKAEDEPNNICLF